MLVLFALSAAANLCLLFFIAKRFYYNKIPPVLWRYDIAMLGDSHVYRGRWNELLGCRVANFGKGGATLQDIFNMLSGVINCNPKTCFIHGGINDIINEVPLEITIGWYQSIIQKLKEAGIRPVIIKVMNLKFPGYENAVAELNKRIECLAESISIDIIPDDLDTDGIHMTGTGYGKWGEAIKVFLLI